MIARARARPGFVGPALAALGLVVTLPRTGAGTTTQAPTVTLDSLRVGPDGALAAVPGGGTAELTLDPALQRAAQRLLAQAHPTAGAAIAMDPRTGRLLAWAGVRGSTPAPGLVPSLLAPAASLFKIVTTTALLEKRVSPDRPVCVDGGTSFISRAHLTAPRAGRALCAPFREALGRSRNAVFAQLSNRFLRPDELLATAERLGFGRDVPFDLPASAGTVEVPEGDLEFARAAAGFVGSRLSPLGAANLAMTIATGGRSLRLHLVRRADGYEAPRRRETLGRAMSEETARQLVRMMELTVHSGTSREVFTTPEGGSYLGDVRAAGKTGTLHPEVEGPMTSWFIGFAPSRRPRVVLGVLLENGTGWRRRANEVGRDLFRAYFSPRGYRGVTMPDGI